MQIDYTVDEMAEAIETILNELEIAQNNYELAIKQNISYKQNIKDLKENRISKKKIEKYLAEETERYKVYKKEVDKNENLRPQLWNHLGRKNMCEKILGIEKTVTLD